MESRQEQLSQLRDFIRESEKEVALILQTLQWDKNSLLQPRKEEPMVTCKYDENHRIPLKTQKLHEEKCFLKSQGYKSDELFLPEPLDADAKTLVKFTSDEIKQIIDTASKNDPLFKRGKASVESQPLTLERIAATYTTDERRAIHDAVVNTMPSFHDLSDLALPSSSSGASETKPKSRLEVLAELRDMRRRRAKYRGSAPAKNYSHTLRELIATQMELYTGSNVEIKIEQNDQKTNKTRNDTHRYDVTNDDRHTWDKHRHQHAHSEKYSKGNMRENFRDREHYTRDDKEKYNNNGRHAEKRERDASYSKDKYRRYSRHDDRKRRERHNDSYSDDRSSTSKDRRRENENREEQYRGRKEEKYKRDEKEYTRYYDYDRYEKSSRHTSKEKSRTRDYR